MHAHAAGCVTLGHINLPCTQQTHVEVCKCPCADLPCYVLAAVQGMSISKLVVSLQRSFAAGMVYVALSRCTSREGLQVRRAGVAFCQ